MRTAAIAISFTLVLHGLVSLALAVPSVLAPVAAPTLGLPASAVGLMVGLAYFAVAPAALACGALAARFGARRLCLGAAAVAYSGLLLCAATGLAARWFTLPALFGALLLMAGVCIGSALAFMNAVGAQILFAATPARIRSVAFSIKQTAVPLGGMLAGLVLPALLLRMPWDGAIGLLAVAALAAAFALVVLPISDARSNARAARRIALAELTTPLLTVWSRPHLRDLALIGVVYNACQISLAAYMITFLTLEAGVTLVTAGAVFSAFNMTAVAARVAWGVSVDALGSPRRHLGVIGLISILSFLLIANISPSWPLPAMIAVAVLAGASVLSWNGIFLAEVARLAAPGEVASTTGGMLAFLSLGGGGGPALFALIIALSGSYYAAFMAFVALLLIMMLRLFAPRPGEGR